MKCFVLFYVRGQLVPDISDTVIVLCLFTFFRTSLQTLKFDKNICVQLNKDRDIGFQTMYMLYKCHLCLNQMANILIEYNNII